MITEEGGHIRVDIFLWVETRDSDLQGLWQYLKIAADGRNIHRGVPADLRMGGGVMIWLNRIQKTVRNLLACVLLAGCLYASMSFPPYTVGGMCCRFQHDYLLGELEPLHVQGNAARIGNQTVGARFTMVLASSGDIYVSFRYQGGYRLDFRFQPEISEGTICVARGERIYAAGPFEGAVSAVAVVRVEKWPAPNGAVKVREFTLEEERLANGVFAFPNETGFMGQPGGLAGPTITGS